MFFFEDSAGCCDSSSCLWLIVYMDVSGFICVFFFQAEDGIRGAQESRGLGDVYKRQFVLFAVASHGHWNLLLYFCFLPRSDPVIFCRIKRLSLIHI